MALGNKLGTDDPVERAHGEGRVSKAAVLLAGGLSADLDDAALLSRGMNASSTYEGYAAYRTAEL